MPCHTAWTRFIRELKGKQIKQLEKQTWQCHDHLDEGLGWVLSWNLSSSLLHMAQDQEMLEKDWTRSQWWGLWLVSFKDTRSQWWGFWLVSFKDTWTQGDCLSHLLPERTVSLPAALQKRIVSTVAFALKWYTCSLSCHASTLNRAPTVLHCNNCSIPYCLRHGQSVPRNPKQLSDWFFVTQNQKMGEVD